MKWTYDWLKDYLKTTASPDVVADVLTKIGLEVEELILPIYPIAAKIIECDPVPESDHLHILKLDDGSGTLRQVVCGAPNARIGLVSALAVPGCVVGDTLIKSGKLRGILSDGMMCSGKELGLSNDHDGIIELDEKLEVLGQTITALRGAPSAVFDAGITPNRPDYLSVRGIARDLAASGLGTYVNKNVPGLFQIKSKRTAHVLNKDGCPIYRFCEINGIKNKPANPLVAARLKAIGINPKNAPIDVTNYVCYDMGQPMHCFDADEIDGDISVRLAKVGEKFTDLFGNNHDLLDTDLVITDATGILALAGVIGGARGMTTDKTTNIILESAYFTPVVVRKTSKRLGISTDASYRYERGIDPTMTGIALGMATEMIMDVCGGELVGVGVAGDAMMSATKILYRPDMFLKKTGVILTPEKQKKILESLDFVVQDNGGGQWTVLPTSARVDIQIPENIVSELIRLYGYDKIESRGTYSAASGVASHGLNINLKKMLAGRGLSERISFGFGNAVSESMLSDGPIIKLANPITAEMDTARNGLLGNMLDAVADNEKRGYPDLNMFEIGTVFDGDTPGAQHTQMVIVRTGETSPKHWQRRNRNVDVFDVKADLAALIGTDMEISTDNPPKWAHPFRYGAVMYGTKKIAEFGEIHPLIARAWKIKTSVMIALVDDVTALPAVPQRKLVEQTEFQPITRDFAFITEADFPADKIVASAALSDDRITDVVVFDAFDLGDEKKSIAFTVTLLPKENMSDADLNIIQNAVIAMVEKNCPAKIRDK